MVIVALVAMPGVPTEMPCTTAVPHQQAVAGLATMQCPECAIHNDPEAEAKLKNRAMRTCSTLLRKGAKMQCVISRDNAARAGRHCYRYYPACAHSEQMTESESPKRLCVADAAAATKSAPKCSSLSWLRRKPPSWSRPQEPVQPTLALYQVIRTCPGRGWRQC